jgi:hypothetical protein
MARQKGISISRLEEIIDLMREKGVAKLTIPDSVDILLFPESPRTGASDGQLSIDEIPVEGDNDMSEMDILLMSSK